MNNLLKIKYRKTYYNTLMYTVYQSGEKYLFELKNMNSNEVMVSKNFTYFLEMAADFFPLKKDFKNSTHDFLKYIGIMEDADTS